MFQAETTVSSKCGTRESRENSRYSPAKGRNGLHFFGIPRQFQYNRWFFWMNKMTVSSGGSRISQTWGWAPTPYYFAKCVPKIAWKWKNLDRTGGGESLPSYTPPRTCQRFPRNVTRYFWHCLIHVAKTTAVRNTNLTPNSVFWQIWHNGPRFSIKQNSNILWKHNIYIKADIYNIVRSVTSVETANNSYVEFPVTVHLKFF